MAKRLTKDGRIEEIVENGTGGGLRVRLPLVLGRHGFLGPEAAGEAANERHGDTIVHHRETLERLVDAAQKQINGLKYDAELSQTGRFNKINAVRMATVEQMGKSAGELRRKLDQTLEAARKAVPTKLEAPPRPTPPAPEFDHLTSAERSVVNALHRVGQDFTATRRAEEIRAHLRAMDPAIRNSAIRAAAENGDVELLLAVQEAPLSVRPGLMNDETWGNVVDRYLRVTHSAKFEAVDAAVMALSIIDGNTNAALKAIGTEPPRDDGTAGSGRKAADPGPTPQAPARQSADANLAMIKA